MRPFAANLQIADNIMEKLSANTHFETQSAVTRQTLYPANVNQFKQRHPNNRGYGLFVC